MELVATWGGVYANAVPASWECLRIVTRQAGDDSFQPIPGHWLTGSHLSGL